MLVFYLNKRPKFQPNKLHININLLGFLLETSHKSCVDMTNFQSSSFFSLDDFHININLLGFLLEASYKSYVGATGFSPLLYSYWKLLINLVWVQQVSVEIK